MSTAYPSSTGFADEREHFRDGSLLKRKREQWAREKACSDSWFPFGSPGGGAPNRKYEPIDPHTSDIKTEKRPPSRHSNGDSGRWSGSENNPSKEESEVIEKNISERAPYPCSVASTSTAHPRAVILTQSPQMIVDGGQQCLPPVGGNHGAPFLGQVSTPSGAATVPVQFVYAQSAYGQAVPVPVEVVQSPSGVPYAYPVRVISPVAVNLAPATSADGVRHEQLPLLPSSYTEHWANQLSYWGSTTLRQEENAKTSQTTQTNIDSATCITLPPIGGGIQPVAIPRSIALPVLASPPSGDRQFSPAQQSGTDDGIRKSRSESLTSLNSSSRRSADGDARGRTKQAEQIYNEQVAERRRIEAQRLEEERVEAMIKEKERRRMEEMEVEREFEEERRKARAEEERSRMEAAVLASVEKARREAELFKKAKLYKHVLEACEKSVDLEHSILGDDHKENSRILKEIESVERQKKYDLQRMGGGLQPSSAKGALTERGFVAARSKSDPRNGSFDDERPIRGAVNTSSTEPFSRDRRGRQSVRVPSTPKTSLARRADSAERAQSNIGVGSAPAVLQRRCMVSQCAIPVRPQRRIPPPTSRPRRTSANESLTSSTAQLTDAGGSGTPSGEMPSSKQSQSVSEPRSPKMVLRETKSVSDEHEMQFPSPPCNTVSSTSRRKQTGALHPVATSLKQRSGSFDMATIDTALRFHNPLFHPVTTRCRRSRAAMGNTDIARESSSCSSDSPPPLSTEDDSLSSPPHNSTHLSSSDKDASKSAIAKTVTRSSAVKMPNSGSLENVAKSPFKQTLAEWGNTNRHREELLSPEIRRKCEFPNSTRLRNSMANLNSEESGDERASPVSPFIQRFN
uniref:Uncharacterized protein n=1 Tax=Parascaris univalens TaxID=6257 RepID=A0A915BFI4_PARUN